MQPSRRLLRVALAAASASAVPALADPAPAFLVKDVSTVDYWGAFEVTSSAEFADVGGVAYFFAATEETGYELWRSDGTAAGTSVVKDIRVGSQPTESPSIATAREQPTNVGGTLFFTQDDGVNGRELWKSDGTAAGTVLVKDIRPGSAGSHPISLTDANGTLFFLADDGVSGMEIWKSDGTSAGTVLVKDLNSGPPGMASPDILNELVSVNGTIFFSSCNSFGCFGLWKSDGTEAGTLLVRDIATGSSDASPDFLTNVNGTLFFAATGVLGRELWTSDGTTAGTVVVKDIAVGGSSNPESLQNADGVLFFSAIDASNNRELWKSDGTSAGTVQVKDIRPGSVASTPQLLTAAGGTLFFTADDGTNGRELWKSDGTEAGTVQVKDIVPGAGSSNPQALTHANGTLFFTADDGATGRELWKSDGTEAGTTLVEERLPGALGTLLDAMLAVGSRVVFVDNDGVSGEELWTSDGTPAGTHRVADVAPGGGSMPSFGGSTVLRLIAEAGPLVMFSAHADTTGRELYAVPLAALADGDQDGLEDQNEVAEGTNPDDPDSDDDGLADGAEVLTHGTDPLDEDTDGDGYDDGFEIDHDTDPLDPEDFPQAQVPLFGPWGIAVLAALLALAARRPRSSA